MLIKTRYPLRQRQYPLIDPRLFKSSVRDHALEIFLCGPGFGHADFNFRDQIKKYLIKYNNVSVKYGEELDHLKIRVRKNNIDLQTLESEYASKVDFTILLVNSPGSIAELGTFSMIDHIRPRLVAVVPDNFYMSQSYIARGPLSILASQNQNNVIFMDFKESGESFTRLNYSICLFKFAQYKNSANYFLYSRLTSYRDKYRQFIEDKKVRFLTTTTLMSINILPEPTFSELVAFLQLSPEDLSAALKLLYQTKSIQKIRRARYIPTRGYDDPLLECFDSRELSKRRAEIIASNY